MNDTLLSSGLDNILVALPFIGMLMVGFFRLDEILAAPRKRLANKPLHPPCGVDLDGNPIVCDPDGRPWGNPRMHRLPGRFPRQMHFQFVAIPGQAKPLANLPSPDASR